MVCSMWIFACNIDYFLYLSSSSIGSIIIFLNSQKTFEILVVEYNAFLSYERKVRLKEYGKHRFKPHARLIYATFNRKKCSRSNAVYGGKMASSEYIQNWAKRMPVRHKMSELRNKNTERVFMARCGVLQEALC